MFIGSVYNRKKEGFILLNIKKKIKPKNRLKGVL